jgi:hypothetical protein
MVSPGRGLLFLSCPWPHASGTPNIHDFGARAALGPGQSTVGCITLPVACRA